MSTVEWNIKKPIKKNVNENIYPRGVIINNLKLKKLEKYKEKTRIYGIDPGCIENIEEINNLSEIELYFKIDAMISYITRCRNEMAYGRAYKIDTTEEEYALEYMIYMTTKFGVTIPEPQYGCHIQKTKSFDAWFEFYTNHFKNILSNEEHNKLKIYQMKNQDIATLLPTENWQESNEKTLKKSKN